MTRHDLDRALYRLAAAQYGAFGHSQARGLGLTDAMLHTRRRSGLHVQLAPGVSAIAAFPPTWQRQYKAAELTTPGAALCGPAAAKIHDLEGARILKPELVVAYTRSVRNRLARVHRSASSLVTTKDGFRVTTVAQTLFDVMSRSTVRQLERAMDGAILAGQAQVADLDERLRAYDGTRRRNLALWRALVHERAEAGWAPPESELEALLARAYALVAGAPPARRQAMLPWWKGGKGRSDLLVDEWRLILEADGRRWHARVRDFDDDRWRDNTAAANGWRVQRFTHTHLAHRLAEVVVLIGDAGTALRAA